MGESGPRSPLHRTLVQGVVGGLKLLPKGTQAWVHQKFEPVGLLDYPSAKIKMLAGNSWQRMRLRSCSKEPETVRWLESQLKPGDVLYDVGANVGAYSLLAATIQKECKVFAFEPSATTFGVLAQNVALNGLGDRLNAYCVALSSENGLATFRHSDISAGAALHELEAHLPTGDKLQQAALMLSLDNFIATFKAPAPTLIKIDIDGAEMAFLQGAKKTLANPSLRSVLLEITLGDVSEEQVVQTVHGLGFKTASRDKRGNDDTYNWVFEREPATVAR